MQKILIVFGVRLEPSYYDFHPSDIRHSNANTTKAQNFVGYAPTHDIYQGMEEAIGWYIKNINNKDIE